MRAIECDPYPQRRQNTNETIKENVILSLRIHKKKKTTE